MVNRVLAFFALVLTLAASVPATAGEAVVSYREPGRGYGNFGLLGGVLSDFNRCEVEISKLDGTMILNRSIAGLSGGGGQTRTFDVTATEQADLVGMECIPEARVIEVQCFDNAGNPSALLRYFRVFLNLDLQPTVATEYQVNVATSQFRFREPGSLVDTGGNLDATDSLDSCTISAVDTGTMPETVVESQTLAASGVGGSGIKSGTFANSLAGVDEYRLFCTSQGVPGPTLVLTGVEDVTFTAPANTPQVSDD